jgi:hypothetical protein
VKDISLEEPLTRFIFDSGHVKDGGSRAKFRAFFPKATEADVSISRIENLDPDDIWALGDSVGAERRRAAIARADFTRRFVQSLRTRVPGAPEFDTRPDPPPVTHALLVGWPDADGPRRNLCQILAAKAATRPRGD